MWIYWKKESIQKHFRISQALHKRFFGPPLYYVVFKNVSSSIPHKKTPRFWDSILIKIINTNIMKTQNFHWIKYDLTKVILEFQNNLLCHNHSSTFVYYGLLLMICMNANIMKTHFFIKSIIYDLKCYFYVKEKFCDFLL